MKGKWGDSAWISNRKENQALDQPLYIYEIHAGSWRRKTDGTEYLSYKELADYRPYIKNLGFTHVELLPIAEHPYDP